MPIYEYRCTGCGEVFEYMQRMSDAPKSECEACGAQLERLISASAFQFKGGGWYSDLYASPKKEAPAKAEGSGDSGSAGKSESGSGSGSGSGSESKAASSGGSKSSGGDS